MPAGQARSDIPTTANQVYGIRGEDTTETLFCDEPCLLSLEKCGADLDDIPTERNLVYGI